MKLGAENKRQLITLGVLGFIAIGAVAYTFLDFSSGPSAPPPTPPVVTTTTTTSTAGTTIAASAQTVAAPAARVQAAPGNEAKSLAKTGGQLDPTLHMEAMLTTEALVYSGTGRNIFSSVAPPPPPPKIPTPVGPARPQQTAVIGPPPPPPGPPPPPPIDLKFFGTITAQNGRRQAFLLHGDDVFLASNGDVVQRRYRVISVTGNAIEIEDMPNNNKQTLPLQAN